MKELSAYTFNYTHKIQSFDFCKHSILSKSKLLCSRFDASCDCRMVDMKVNAFCGTWTPELYGSFYLEVVDFCSGANDFSFLTKKRVDEMGKKRCTYNVVSLQGIGLHTAFGLQQRIDESKETTSALELLRKIRQLEHLHAHIKQNICKRRSVSQLADGALDLCGVMEPFALKLTTESRVFEYNAVSWIRAAENLYDYMVAEVCGKNPIDLLMEAKFAMCSSFVLKRNEYAIT
ncbi:hypothetical protein Tco_0851150 [Tanacetum coccineum]